jgi:C1A family cysteine protease
MKKTNYFYLTLLLLAFSFSTMRAQSFIKIDEAQSGQYISVAPDQVLEVQLPATPSTGYAWYLRDANNEIIKQVGGVLEQVGEWEFVSDDPEHPIGASGKQIIRFISKAAGTANLNFSYVRPWSAEAPENQYHVAIKSDGAYTGNYKAPESEELKSDESNVQRSSALPAAFSWLEQKKMTVVKNQGSCGSCWAFAACGQFEANIKRFDNVTRDLSEQWMVNCDPNSNGCSGGWCPNNLFRTKGAVYEADVPYKGKDGTCASTYTYHEKILSYKEIATSPTPDQIKEAIFKYGPLWVAVCVGSNFNAYRTGVLTKTDAGTVNHAVVLCGWDDATQSWVLRNSWGTSWGENQGYMRIKYGVCKIGYKATYMIYKDATTGVDEAEGDGLVTIYPNPIVDGNRLTINLNHFESNEAVTITINDIQGKVVFKQQEKQNGKVEIDAQAFASGLYFVNLSSANKTENYKVAKQ